LNLPGKLYIKKASPFRMKPLFFTKPAAMRL